jgi:cell division protein FtsX
MTTIAIISVAIIAFAVGVAFGVYATCKAIASGKVENVKVTG